MRLPRDRVGTVTATLLWLALFCSAGVWADPVRLHVGAELELERRLEIAAGTDRVAFQSGRIVAALDPATPGCVLRVIVSAAEPQVLRPDRFRVVRITDDWDYADNDKLHVYSTEMVLHSSRQPQVVGLVCTWRHRERGQNYVSLEQLRDILAGSFAVDP